MKNLAGCIVVLLACSWTPSVVFGQVNARISDVAKFKGQRVNRLQGIGLVVGLAGTGDGDSYKQTMKPLATWLTNYANPVGQLEATHNTTALQHRCSHVSPKLLRPTPPAQTPLIIFAVINLHNCGQLSLHKHNLPR